MSLNPRVLSLPVVVILATFAAGLGVGALSKDVLAWRIQVYTKKMLGEFPEVGWTELADMTFPTNAYGLNKVVSEGRSLNASIENPHVMETDVRAGEQLFTQRCSMCHGADGSGGNAPSLRRPSYNHGDSSFAIYRVIRDGVAQTAMVG